MNKKVKRVGHIISELGTGGVEAMLMNVYREIDKSKIQFDFIVHNKPIMYYEEIYAMGGKVYELPPLNQVGVYQYCKQLYFLIKQNNFEIIHAHNLLQNSFILLIARLAGTKVRVSHSHLTTYHKKITRYLSPVFKFLIEINATQKLACGLEAGKNLYIKNDFIVVPNAINIDRFINAKSLCLVNSAIGGSRDQVITIGHIGRLSEQKNPYFIIDLVKDIVKNSDINFHVYMVGEGPLKNEIEKKIEEFNLQSYISLLGRREDIPELLKTFDVLLLPSLYEGLPVVLVEAQAAGLPVLVSNKITQEADMDLQLLTYLPIEYNSISIWQEKIKESKMLIKPSNEEIKKKLFDKGYNVVSTINLLYKIYELCEEI